MSWRFGRQAAVATLAVALIAATAPQSEDPDWPCQQRLVPKLGPAAYWNGPLDMQGDWQADPAVAGLVRQLAPRRVTAEQGLAAIAALAQTVSDDRTHRLTLAFRGLLEETDRQRADLIERLKQIGRRQHELAELVARLTSELDAMPTDRKPPVIDSCYAYRSDGEVVRRRWPQFYTGDTEGQPGA